MNQQISNSESGPDFPFFLVFSDDWGEHPSSCQHLFCLIGREHEVLWVNTIGMRNMELTLNDVQKGLRKIKKMIFGASKQREKESSVNLRVKVIQPFMLPFVRNPFVRWLNAQSVTRSVKKGMRLMRQSNPIVVTTVPNSCDYIGNFDEKKIVYYCVDNFSEWPGLDRSLVRLMEEKLTQKANCIVVTSSNLYDHHKSIGKPITLMTHGVDVEHFSVLPEREHPLLAKIPKPRVGYYGLFDERSDQNLLAAISTQLPSVSFVITGKVETDIRSLDKLPNVHFVGSVPYKELPSVVVGWEACILPYKRNKLTDNISPLKLKEYIATGKPIVATSLPEVKDISFLLNVSDSSEEWLRYLRKILLGNDSSEEDEIRKSYLTKESWQQKRIIFYNILVG